MTRIRLIVVFPAIAYCLLLASCTRPPSEEEPPPIPAPTAPVAPPLPTPGSSSSSSSSSSSEGRLPVKVTQTVDVVTSGGTSKSVETARSTAGAAAARGDKADVSHFQSTPPGATLPGGASSMGGGTTSAASASILRTSWVRILVGVIGLLTCAWALCGLYLKHELVGTLTTLLKGIALLACTWDPDLALWFLLGYVGVSLLPGAWTSAVAGAYRESTRAVAAGVDDFIKTAPSNAANQLLGFIKTHSSEKDKAVIKRVKKADNLTAEPRLP